MKRDIRVQAPVEAVLKALPEEGRILAAVSGGPDSVALLRALHTIVAENERRWLLRVAHVNHGLRGMEAQGDEDFVRALAAELGLPLAVVAVDTMQHAEKAHLSLETAARELRYQALSRLLDEWPDSVLVTGHTADDQAETFVMHAIRGAGVAGLAGMAPQSGRLIRPFLGMQHETILDALEAWGQEYRLDSSNLDRRFRRNRIRHDVMPLLEEIQPRAARALARSAWLAGLDADFIRQEAERAVQAVRVGESRDEVRAARGVWQSLHPALRRHTLRLLLQHVLGTLSDIEERHISLLMEALESGKEQLVVAGQLPHGLVLYIEGSEFTLRRGARPKPPRQETVDLVVPGTVELATGRLTAALVEGSEWEDRERIVAVSGPWSVVCDAEHVGPRLTIRARRAGDRMQPLGMSGSRKLQDIMVDHRVPAAKRDLVPVVCSDEHIVWLPGLALDRRAAVSERSARLVHLRLEPLPAGA